MKYKQSLVFGIIATCCLLLIGGCANQQHSEQPEPIAEVPTITLEATVVSLTMDSNTDCEEKCPGNVYPKDRGVIRIDKILSTGGGYNAALTGIEEGSEVEVELTYSARPAKVRKLPAPAGGEPAHDNVLTTTGVPSFAQPIPKEDGYFIYEFQTTLVDTETETILPGLEVGSTFTGMVIYFSSTMISVGEYEVIY